MVPALHIYRSSLGRKFLMSLTGLFLCSFLVVHLSGNLSLFFKDGGKAFNLYTQFMSHNMLIRITEIGLLLGFVLHICDGIYLTIKNRGARPEGYIGKPDSAARKEKNAKSLLSRTMIVSGSVILFFLILHLKTYWFTLKFGHMPTAEYDGVVVKDMYTVVVTSFQNGWYALIYVISIVLLGAHLNHGIQSSFQSLGLRNKTYGPLLEKLGSLFAIVIVLAFSAFPIYFYFCAA